MGDWLIILLLFLIGAGIYVFWKYSKRLQRELRVQAAQLHSKMVEIQTKDADLQVKQGQLRATSAELHTKETEIQI